MLLNAAEILKARDKKTVEVEVPEWGADAKVLVGTMGALEYAHLQDWLRTSGHVKGESAGEKRDDEKDSIRVLTCDSPGGQPETLPEDEHEEPEPATEQPADEREYTMTEHWELILRWVVGCVLDPQTYGPAFAPDEIEALGRKNPRALQRIAEAAMRLHYETEGAAEEFLKNSAGTPSGASGGG